jgi:hypothetical protein
MRHHFVIFPPPKVTTLPAQPRKRTASDQSTHTKDTLHTRIIRTRTHTRTCVRTRARHNTHTTRELNFCSIKEIFK